MLATKLFLLAVLTTAGVARAGDLLAEPLTEADDAVTEQIRPFKLFGAIIDTRGQSRPHLSQPQEAFAAQSSQEKGLGKRPALETASTHLAASPHAMKTDPQEGESSVLKEGVAQQCRKKKPRTAPNPQTDERALALQALAHQFPSDHFVHLVAQHPRLIPVHGVQPPLPPTPGVKQLLKLQNTLSTSRHKNKVRDEPGSSGPLFGQQFTEEYDEANKGLRKAIDTSYDDFKAAGRSPAAMPEDIERARKSHLAVKTAVMANRFHVRAWNTVDQLSGSIEQEAARLRARRGNKADAVHAKWNSRLAAARASIEREFGARHQPPFTLPPRESGRGALLGQVRHEGPAAQPDPRPSL